MKHGKNLVEKLLYLINIILVCVCANCFYLIERFPVLVPVFAVGLILSNLLPMYSANNFPDRQTKICNHGTKCLKIFSLSVTVSIAYHIVTPFYLFQSQWTQWVFSALVCVCVESIIFWNGIISVYSTSLQLGMKLRLLGIVFGLIPVAHLFMLGKIIHITSEEVRFETEKYQINLARHNEQICSTKYPILLVHGVFFRDFKYFNYWGRVPNELTKNGARIYYGEHQSAASVEASPNDGLVGDQSFRWGENYTFLTVPGKRGISHGDMIDLNRENIPGFDVREFNVELVCNLKRRGL